MSEKAKNEKTDKKDVKSYDSKHKRYTYEEMEHIFEEWVDGESLASITSFDEHSRAIKDVRTKLHEMLRDKFFDKSIMISPYYAHGIVLQLRLLRYLLVHFSQDIKDDKKKLDELMGFVDVSHFLQFIVSEDVSKYNRVSTRHGIYKDTTEHLFESVERLEEILGMNFKVSDKFKKDEKSMAEPDTMGYAPWSKNIVDLNPDTESGKARLNRRKEKEKKRKEEKKGVYSRETQKYLKKSIKKKMETLSKLMRKEDGKGDLDRLFSNN